MRLRTRPCAAGEFIKFSVTLVASQTDSLPRSENCCQCEHQSCSYQEIGWSGLVLLFKRRYMLTIIIHRDYFLCFGWFTGGKTHMASPWLHLSEAEMITNSTHSNVSMRSYKGPKSPKMTRLWGYKYWILSSGDIKTPTVPISFRLLVTIGEIVTNFVLIEFLTQSRHLGDLGELEWSVCWK